MERVRTICVGVEDILVSDCPVSHNPVVELCYFGIYYTLININDAISQFEVKTFM